MFSKNRFMLTARQSWNKTDFFIDSKLEGVGLGDLQPEKLLNCRTCGLHHLIFLLHVKQEVCYWSLIYTPTTSKGMAENKFQKLGCP